MSPGQTGHITGQMGRVPGQTGRTPGGVPPKFFVFIGLSPINCYSSLLAAIKRYYKIIFQPASRLEELLEGLLGVLGGFWQKFPDSGRGPRLLRSCLGVEISKRIPSEVNF